MSKRILIVEDQEEPRVYCTTSSRAQYTVIEAGDGEAGVARAKSDRPDLVRMDI
jgi:DNA-binding response OmpR family regulator